jgi:hypothetical protein
LSRLQLSAVTKPLERGDRGDGDGRRLLERQRGRLQSDAILADDEVLGEGSGLGAEDVVADLEPGDVLPHRFDRSREVDAQPGGLRIAQPGVEAHEVRRPSHEMPVERIDGSRAHLHQSLIVGGHGFFDVFEPQHGGLAVLAVDDGFHGVGRRGLRPVAGVRRTEVRDGQGDEADDDHTRESQREPPEHPAPERTAGESHRFSFQ